MESQWKKSGKTRVQLGDELSENCNLPPALLADWLVSFTYIYMLDCYCGNTGAQQIPMRCNLLLV